LLSTPAKNLLDGYMPQNNSNEIELEEELETIDEDTEVEV